MIGNKMQTYFFTPIQDATVLTFRKGVFNEFPIFECKNTYYFKAGSGYHKLKKNVAGNYVCTNEQYSVTDIQGLPND